MPSYLPTLIWPIYSGWTAYTPTIPKMYWDVYSQEQRIKELCKNYSKCEQYLDIVAKLTNDWAKDYSEEVAAKLDEFAALLDFGSETTITKWIEKNLEYIYDETIAQIFFRLDDSGYLIAHVPSGWSEIKFSTPMDYSDQTTYGRLCLTYDMADEMEIVGI